MKRCVFVTGGANGIGRSIVENFVSEGDNVYFCDIDVQKGKELADRTGATFYNVNVCNVLQFEQCLEQTFNEVGDIDILINNVGISKFKPLTELSVEEFDEVINTNLRSVFISSKKLANHRRKNGNYKYGRIINICSTRYLQSEAGAEAYSASKGGIYSLTHALALSLAPLHITVNGIAPGWIHVSNDEIIREIDNECHLSGRVGTPEDIARLCIFLCKRGNDFINGQTIVVDGGMTVKMIYPE